jgi:hypothetical protein
MVINSKVGCDFINSYIQNQNNQKIYNPLDDKMATEKLSNQINIWHEMGKVSIITMGVYDGFHPNHYGYLLHTLTLGAQTLYDRTNKTPSWNELDTNSRESHIIRALGSGALKLIVSIDSDSWVEYRKSNKPEKADIPVPLYGWQNRARMIADSSYSDINGNPLSLVSAITTHTGEDCAADKERGLLDQYELVSKLKPNVWGIYGESTDIINKAPLRNELSETSLIVIPNGPNEVYTTEPYWTNPKISTSNMCRHIKNFSRQ